MTNEERIEKLERDLRLTRWALLGLAAALGVYAWSHPIRGDKPPSVPPVAVAAGEVRASTSEIRASAFILVDEQGVPRAHLAMQGGGQLSRPRLLFTDAAGRTNVLLVAGTRFSSLSLRDSQGQARMDLSQKEDESTLMMTGGNGKLRVGLANAHFCGTCLVLNDEAGTQRAMLTSANDTGQNQPALKLADAKGGPRVVVNVTTNGPGIFMNDEDHRMRTSLTVSGDGPILGMYDKNETTRAAMMGGVTEGASFSVCKESGELVWTAP